MFSWMRNKILNSSVNNKYKIFNQYTKGALALKTDEEFKKYCFQCFEKISKENKKDIKSLSLADISRVLNKINKKAPKLLRKITLKQFQQALTFTGTAGNFMTIISAIASPFSLVYLALKLKYKEKAKYAFGIWVVTWIAREIYEKIPKKNAKWSFHNLFNFFK